MRASERAARQGKVGTLRTPAVGELTGAEFGTDCRRTAPDDILQAFEPDKAVLHRTRKQLEMAFEQG